MSISELLQILSGLINDLMVENLNRTKMTDNILFNHNRQDNQMLTSQVVHSHNDLFEDPGSKVARKTISNPIEKDKSIELEEEEAKQSEILKTDTAL